MQTIAKRAWHRLRTLAPEYALYPLIVLIVLLVMGAFTGRFLTTDNPYGSYTIQACAWLEGHLDVNPNFTWLELAEYGGKNGWQIERCYMMSDEVERAKALMRIEKEHER